MVKIKMLKSRTGSPDGLRSCFYEAGETYDMGKELALAFLGMRGVAEDVSETIIFKVQDAVKDMLGIKDDEKREEIKPPNDNDADDRKNKDRKKEPIKRGR